MASDSASGAYCISSLRASVRGTLCSRATMHETMLRSDEPVRPRNMSQASMPSSLRAETSLEVAFTTTARGKREAMTLQRERSGSSTVTEIFGGRISSRFSVTRPAPVIMILRTGAWSLPQSRATACLSSGSTQK